MSTPIVTVTLFRFKHWTNRWWIFKEMGFTLWFGLKEIEGLQFGKLLGSGGGNGFSIFPNFGVYAFLGVWDNENTAKTALETHSFFQQLTKKSTEQGTFFMQTAVAHGQWDKQTPFVATCALDKQKPVAVLTRATIYTKHLLDFWQYVPTVSRSITQQNPTLAIGIGELPLIQQATFSLWPNSEAIMNYAYKSKHHKAVVQRTRQKGWYKEELFARFHPYHAVGNWEGKQLELLFSKDTMTT